jgi:hypothetical protein
VPQDTSAGGATSLHQPGELVGAQPCEVREVVVEEDVHLRGTSGQVSARDRQKHVLQICQAAREEAVIPSDTPSEESASVLNLTFCWDFRMHSK